MQNTVAACDWAETLDKVEWKSAFILPKKPNTCKKKQKRH